MKNIIIVLFVMMTNIASAQNSAIFNGGNADGWNKTAFAQVSNNIFTGGIGDGWDKAAFSQPINNIFIGGNGDGWDKATFIQGGNNIYVGGIGDGWASQYIPLGPLPVTFLSFTARKSSKTSSLLEWETSQEINSDRFEVERSGDALFFSKIGTVAAAGNSSFPQQYSFTDNNPKGINYYRLKQVDINGKFIFTPVRLVKFGEINSETVKYYPNPTNGILIIELDLPNVNEPHLINISNAGGIMVNQIKIVPSSGNKIQIDLSRYAKGTYFIQVRTPTLNSTQRVVLN